MPAAVTARHQCTLAQWDPFTTDYPGPLLELDESGAVREAALGIKPSGHDLPYVGQGIIGVHFLEQGGAALLAGLEFRVSVPGDIRGGALRRLLARDDFRADLHVMRDEHFEDEDVRASLSPEGEQALERIRALFRIPEGSPLRFRGIYGPDCVAEWFEGHTASRWSGGADEAAIYSDARRLQDEAAELGVGLSLTGVVAHLRARLAEAEA